ncbi:MAG: hypothetical protein QXU75_09380 [Candidatus Methanomethylicaceae archaeon]
MTVKLTLIIIGDSYALMHFEPVGQPPKWLKEDSLCFTFRNIDTPLYILKKYAKVRTQDLIKYEADLQDNVALALYYSKFMKISESEVDEIISTGTTKLHTLRALLGDEKASDLFSPIQKTPNTTLVVAHFPKVTLRIDGILVSLICDDVTPDSKIVNFLRRALHNNISAEELAAIRGISLLRDSSQIKYATLLARGELSMRKLAKVICRAAKRYPNWKDHIKWLEDNNCEQEVAEVIAYRGLVN